MNYLKKIYTSPRTNQLLLAAFIILNFVTLLTRDNLETWRRVFIFISTCLFVALLVVFEKVKRTN